jgi:hypothetical protein
MRIGAGGKRVVELVDERSPGGHGTRGLSARRLRAGRSEK